MSSMLISGNPERILHLCSSVRFVKCSFATLLMRVSYPFDESTLVLFSWIDEFAPESAATMWMGLIQGGTVFGVMVSLY